MAPADASTSPSSADVPAESSPARQPWTLVGLGVILGLAVLIAGAPSLEAPWVMGDEFIFIVDNPDVTGAGLSNDSIWRRLKLIFQFPPREDLYQPLPIVTYALELALWGDAPQVARRTDVLLHAVNALLVWWAFALLLERTAARAGAALRHAFSWALALLWALHPAVANTYAADMGRTHLLSTLFALLSLGLHIRSLSPGRWPLFLGAWLALLAAMLCKAVVGWVLLALVLELWLVGWRRTLRSPRIYAIAGLCVLFAGLTYYTSQSSGVAQDAAAGLFGDPLARSALAVWIYFRNLIVPLWLSPWHLPDPHTHWANPLVWVGLLLAAASAMHAGRAWQRVERRGITLGWVWCWATLLPVIGLVGAREAAATDRYLYQPLLGVLFVVGVVTLRWLARAGGSGAKKPARAVLIGAAVLGVLLLLWDLPYVVMYRSTIGRGERIAALNAGDPRAREALAAAYDFATNHRLPASDLAQVPAGQEAYTYFAQKAVETLREAAATQDLGRFFPGPADRAPFHRRLSFRFKQFGQFEESLAQAELARRLQPDAYLTWVRLAHAYQGLGRRGEAVAAYARCEELLPDDPATRATYYTDFGYLLLFDLERADLAFPKFRAAVATGQARMLAYIGLARCEIRVGEGARGFQIISDVLAREPSVQAGLVLAEYHLRSHHFEQAATLYAALVDDYPAAYRRRDCYYEALRGYQSVCEQLGRWRDAALAWDRAVRLHPDSREFRSLRVWALACAGDAEVAHWADDLLASDPDNPLVCFARMLHAVRTNEIRQAVDWARRAFRGTPIPKAREAERATALLRLLRARDELPPAAVIVEAVIYAAAGHEARARELLDDFLAAEPNSSQRALAEEVRRGISDEPGGNRAPG